MNLNDKKDFVLRLQEQVAIRQVVPFPERKKQNKISKSNPIRNIFDLPLSPSRRLAVVIEVVRMNCPRPLTIMLKPL